MNKKTFYIPNISCNHCVKNIKNELEGLKGVSKAEGDAITKEIIIEYEAPATIEKIRETLREINYPPKD